MNEGAGFHGHGYGGGLPVAFRSQTFNPLFFIFKNQAFHGLFSFLLPQLCPYQLIPEIAQPACLMMAQKTFALE